MQNDSGRLVEQQPVSLAIERIAEELVQALAHLDADRLEEFVWSCRGRMADRTGDQQIDLGANRRIRCEIEALGRTLELTRANLLVLRRADGATCEYSYAEE